MVSWRPLLKSRDLGLGLGLSSQRPSGAGAVTGAGVEHSKGFSSMIEETRTCCISFGSSDYDRIDKPGKEGRSGV